MFLFLNQISGSQLGALHAIPPNYIAFERWMPRIINSVMLLFVSILVITPWKKYEKQKRNFMSAYTVVLAVSHFSVTDSILQAIGKILSPILFYILLYGIIMVLNMNKTFLNTTSLLSIGYLFGCHVAILIGFTKIYSFLIAVGIGLAVAFILRKIGRETTKEFFILFTGWILFCFIDCITANKILDLTGSPRWFMTLIPKAILVLFDSIAFFIAIHRKEIEEIQDNVIEKTNEKI
ncbi:hypothetical protein EHP00_1795 [Ecytonucleospora hepatopenaei]|uniref:Uncharacterized protein n=1 Tax=Ecytonucleospora hepatopenaei TaxID=646526 RepID=A0A1W0E498_9MICR|nr:hypothetical protein EHP00_1795 [Ecytonucleospora hepatopenaei]